MPVGERPARAAFLVGPEGAGEWKLPPQAGQEGSAGRRCQLGFGSGDIRLPAPGRLKPSRSAWSRVFSRVSTGTRTWRSTSCRGAARGGTRGPGSSASALATVLSVTRRWAAMRVRLRPRPRRCLTSAEMRWYKGLSVAPSRGASNGTSATVRILCERVHHYRAKRGVVEASDLVHRSLRDRGLTPAASAIIFGDSGLESGPGPAGCSFSLRSVPRAISLGPPVPRVQRATRSERVPWAWHRRWYPVCFSLTATDHTGSGWAWSCIDR